MRSMRFLTVIIALAILLTATAGCASSNTTTAATTTTSTVEVEETTEETTAPVYIAEKPFIAVISKGFQHKYWQAVKQGAEQAAEEFKVDITFDGPPAEDDSDVQVKLLETALADEPAAICLAAIDSEEVAPALEEADALGIPVISFDSGTDSDLIISSVATDNRAAAAAAGHQLAKLIDEEGEVFVISHDQTSMTGINRRDGFLEAMTQYPDIIVLGNQYSDSDPDKTTTNIKNVLTDNPDVKGIFATNEGAITGAINAVTELELAGEITLVGFDSGKILLDAIRDGTVAGAVSQDPYAIGYEAVKAAVMAINEEEVPEAINTGFHWYTAENIDDPELEAILYE